MASNNSTSKDFYVYIHKRKTDGKVFYVGKGRANRAWVTKSRSAKWHEIQSKYGHIVEIVQNNMQEWWSFELEIETIALYGLENLVNITAGGQGASGTKMKPKIMEMLKRRLKEVGVSEAKKQKLRDANIGKKLSEETKKKISQALKGITHTPEAIANMKAAQSNRSAETRKKIGDSKRGLKRPQSVIDALRKVHSKRVICNETGTMFASCVDAAEWLKTAGYAKAQGRPVSDCAKGKYKKAYGHTFIYA